MDQQHHEMILDMTHASGAEEWSCPTCGRRMLINWRPEFRKTILAVGDDYALHKASKGLIPTIPSDGMPLYDNAAPAKPEANVEDPRFAPWLAWFEAVNFDRLWDGKH